MLARCQKTLFVCIIYLLNCSFFINIRYNFQIIMHLIAWSSFCRLVWWYRWRPGDQRPAASWSGSGWCCLSPFGITLRLPFCQLVRESCGWRRVIAAVVLGGCRAEALRSGIAVATVTFVHECHRPYGLRGWWLSWSKPWRSEACSHPSSLLATVTTGATAAESAP